MSSSDDWIPVPSESHTGRWIATVVVLVIIIAAMGAGFISSYASKTRTVTVTAYSTASYAIYVTQTITSVNTQTVTSVSTSTQSVTQVPDSALVITNESYSNSTNTVSLSVQSTEDYTIYAQFSATMYGNPCCGFGDTAGSYTSSVLQFSPLTTTDVSFNIVLANYYGDCISYVSSTQLYFGVTNGSNVLQVSGEYTFQISPAFPNPYQNCP